MPLPHREAVLLSPFVPTKAPFCLPCAAVSPAPPPRDLEVVDCCRGEGCLGTAIALESDGHILEEELTPEEQIWTECFRALIHFFQDFLQ